MKIRIGAGLTALATVLACGSAQAASVPVVPVHVRIEGAAATLFDGVVRATPHQVDGNDGTGLHPCDGSSSAPGPTVTTAITDAARRAGYIFQAKWYASFGDFLINQIGPDTTRGTRSWTLGADYRSLSVGGCQAKVHAGEQVIASYGTLKQSKHYLKLTGPRSVRSGRRFRVRVVDGANGRPMRGAFVGRARTNAHGYATLRFYDTGVLLLKATRADSVRSNELDVVVRSR